MARTSDFDLSKESIFNTCNKLKAQGVKVTTEAVRNEIGGGAFNTMLPLIKEWKAQQNGISQEKAIELPENCIAAVETAAAVIWKAATEHQAEAIEAIKRECQKIETEALGERDEAFSEISRMERDAEAAEEELEKLKTSDQKKTEQIKNLELQIQKLQLTLDNAVQQTDSARNEARELKTQAAAAQAEINRLTVIAAQREAAKEEISELKAQAAAAQAEINQLKVIAATAQAEINRLTVIAEQHETAKPLLQVKKSTEPEEKANSVIKMKYQNPNNKRQKWSGEGDYPEWLAELASKGHDPDEFLIEKRK